MNLNIMIERATPLERRALKRAALATVKALPKSVTKGLTAKSYLLSITMTTESIMQTINNEFRGKDRPTDVLSFSRLEAPAPFPEIGDVLICRKVAKKQAKEYGATYAEELARLTVHGVLHLFGYDHERSKRDEKIMFSLQEKILRKL